MAGLAQIYALGTGMAAGKLVCGQPVTLRNLAQLSTLIGVGQVATHELLLTQTRENLVAHAAIYDELQTATGHLRTITGIATEIDAGLEQLEQTVSGLSDQLEDLSSSVNEMTNVVAASLREQLGAIRTLKATQENSNRILSEILTVQQNPGAARGAELRRQALADLQRVSKVGEERARKLFEDAEVALKGAIEANPGDYIAHWHLAWIYQNLRYDLDGAVRHYDGASIKSIGVDDAFSSEAHGYLIEALIHAGDITKALLACGDWEKLGYEKGHDEIAYMRARILAKQNDPDATGLLYALVSKNETFYRRAITEPDFFQSADVRSVMERYVAVRAKNARAFIREHRKLAADAVDQEPDSESARAVFAEVLERSLLEIERATVFELEAIKISFLEEIKGGCESLVAERACRAEEFDRQRERAAEVARRQKQEENHRASEATEQRLAALRGSANEIMGRIQFAGFVLLSLAAAFEGYLFYKVYKLYFWEGILNTLGSILFWCLCALCFLVAFVALPTKIEFLKEDEFENTKSATVRYSAIIVTAIIMNTGLDASGLIFYAGSNVWSLWPWTFLPVTMTLTVLFYVHVMQDGGLA